MPPKPYCPGPMRRRDFLQLCTLAAGGLGLANLGRARAAQGQALEPDAPAVIFLWLPGGPPHMETFDMKPDAPAEYRGAFSPIRTTVPGLDVCEHLPKLAGCAKRFSIIRSIAHKFADHGGGHKRFLTGRDPLEPAGFVNDTPMVGSMVAQVQEGRNVGVPNYVAGVDRGRQGIDTFSFGSAYLGPAAHPFFVPGDPSANDFAVENLASSGSNAGRLAERVELLAALDRPAAGLDRTGSMAARDRFARRALDLVTTDKARLAFDLKREPDKLRERYGNHVYGQRCLLARRLVEAGSTFVTMVLENPVSGGKMPKDTCYNWDSHAVNCHIFEDTKFKLPFLDQAVSALIDDIYERGLDRRVMLVVTGEFGRTPRLESKDGRPGRDHWPQAMSVLVSGGGLKVGQVVGSTTARGEHPKDRPLSPNDLWATVFRHLRIDPHLTSFPDHRGRPMSILPDGDPISDLI